MSNYYVARERNGEKERVRERERERESETKRQTKICINNYRLLKVGYGEGKKQAALDRQEMGQK